MTLTSTSVAFFWSSSTGATDYQIEVNGPTSRLETVYSTSYTATLPAGSYTWRVRAHNSAGYSSWTPTWSFTISTPPPAQKGTLVVYIYNVNNRLANYMSGKTVAYLAGNGEAFSAIMNSEGYVTFSDIPVGNYKLSVFHKPQETGALNLEEYWGAESIEVSQGYNEKKFTRSAPWVIDYSVKVGGKEIARPGFTSQEAIDIGSTVDFQISVKNSGTSNTNTKVRLIIDANKASPFDYDQISRWKATSQGSSSIHQFLVSFVAGSQFSEILPAYSAYIVVYSIYDGKEYVTDQYTWTEFVSFKVQFSSEQARIIMQLASQIIDIVLKQHKAVIEETLRRLANGETVTGISIMISPATIEKVSGQTSLTSMGVSIAFRCADIALIVSDRNMIYEEKLDALAEVLAKATIATALEITLVIASKGLTYASLATVKVPPVSLALSATALITYLGRGFISNRIAELVVDNNFGDIKGKVRSILTEYSEPLFKILNKNSVSVSGHCPINMCIYDSRGRRTGVILSGATYSILEEIPGSKFFNKSDHQAVWIAFPESGDYRIVVNGTDQGEYSIVVTTFVEGEAYRNEKISGNINKGEVSIITVMLEEGLTPSIGPIMHSLFISSMVPIGDFLTVSFKVNGKGSIDVTASLRDSNNMTRRSMLVEQGGLYKASIDTSGMEKGPAILTLVAKDSQAVSTTASFTVMLLGRMQIKVQPYKSEAASGEHLKLELVITDQNDNLVDSVNVSLILASNKYVAQNTARGLYSFTFDTSRLEGSYTVDINASKPLYQSTKTSLVLTIRPWWWPYLPYVVLAIIIVVVSLLAFGFKKRGREDDKIDIDKIDIEMLMKAKELLDQGDYAEAVKYYAQALKDRLSISLNLNKSLTDVELVRKVSELRSDVDSKKLSYVISLGDKCTYGRFKPKKEEAETVLKYTLELLKKF